VKRAAELAAVGLTAASLLAGCGSSRHEKVAVRVGNVAITDAAVQHWTSVMAGGRAGSASQTLRHQALAFLVSSEWLIGEADANGLQLSTREVERQLARKESVSYPGGEGEMRESLKATGETVGDLTFEAKAELAAAKLHRMLLRREPAIRHSAIDSYYRMHRESFVIPEQRQVIITNRKTAGEAEQLRREVEEGRSLAAAASKHETLSLPEVVYRRGVDSILPTAIHAAKLNQLSGPVKQHVDYFVFEVKAIKPAFAMTLDQVEGAIRKQLQSDQQKRTVASFAEAWRKRWVARTTCVQPYVVQKCSEYVASATMPLESEAPGALD
jgi:PPIC-type PPIASE domain